MTDDDVFGVEVVNLDDDEPPMIVVIAEACDQGCGDRVRYWNDPSDGNASCGCCTEGPEACARIDFPPVVESLLRRALASIEDAKPRPKLRPGETPY